MASSVYRTETTLERTLRIGYPAGQGRIVLRTELDWQQGIQPVAVSEDGQTHTFRLQATSRSCTSSPVSSARASRTGPSARTSCC